MEKVLIIGAGLAGSEAAMYLARHGIKVVLVESKRLKKNPAQKINDFAELVCTNSLKSTEPSSGHGLLKYEMKALRSLILEVAEETKVPAGDALAVDRDVFSRLITKKIEQEPLIEVIDLDVANPQEVMSRFECDYCIIASGPLTTDKLSEWIARQVSDQDLYFYDAIAPVVDADSLDYSKLYFKDRHRPASESADYLNAPMNEEEYYAFVEELVNADKVPAQSFEEYRFFEACLPIDLMAQRGVDTPRFSCMKPIGLDLEDGTRPFAVVQLRKENLLGSAYNLVGFQNRLTYKEQVRIFKMIPGLEGATFPHLGSVHRNTFINSAKLLNLDLALKSDPRIHFAGQIVGVEGYTESASMGLYAGVQILRKMRNEPFIPFPKETGMGALINYIMTCEKPTPSNINFGLLPSIELSKEQRKNPKRKKLKKELVAKRAREFFDAMVVKYKDVFC